MTAEKEEPPSKVTVFAAAESRRAEREVLADGAAGVVGNGFRYLTAHSRQFANDLMLAEKRAPGDPLAGPLECLEKVPSLQLLERKKLETQAADAVGWHIIVWIESRTDPFGRMGTVV